MTESRKRYGALLDRPHPVSATHAPMSRRNRAAQFSPFAALTGYAELVAEAARETTEKAELSEEARAALDEKLRLLLRCLDEHPPVTVTCFVPDDRKSGGEYRRVSGRLKALTAKPGLLLLEDGARIAFSDIFALESPLFAPWETEGDPLPEGDEAP